VVRNALPLTFLKPRRIRWATLSQRWWVQGVGQPRTGLSCVHLTTSCQLLQPRRRPVPGPAGDTTHRTATSTTVLQAAPSSLNCTPNPSTTHTASLHHHPPTLWCQETLDTILRLATTAWTPHNHATTCTRSGRPHKHTPLGKTQ
jgi:hypothetical protein